VGADLHVRRVSHDALDIDVGEVFGPFGEEPFFLDLSGKPLGSLLWRVDSLVAMR